jgi:hypothetical protein
MDTGLHNLLFQDTWCKFSVLTIFSTESVGFYELFKGRHFKHDIISWAVRWSCKYGMSYRDLEEMAKVKRPNVRSFYNL